MGAAAAAPLVAGDAAEADALAAEPACVPFPPSAPWARTGPTARSATNTAETSGLRGFISVPREEWAERRGSPLLEAASPTGAGRPIGIRNGAASVGAERRRTQATTRCGEVVAPPLCDPWTEVLHRASGGIKRNWTPTAPTDSPRRPSRTRSSFRVGSRRWSPNARWTRHDGPTEAAHGLVYRRMRARLSRADKPNRRLVRLRDHVDGDCGCASFELLRHRSSWRPVGGGSAAVVAAVALHGRGIVRVGEER